ncbi:MAG: ABC transporter ATP-binding protein, partial [Salinivirgaceae bacterium]
MQNVEEGSDGSLFEVRGLHIYASSESIHLVKGIDFNLPKGSITGMVGESGSGKSLTSLSLMQLLSPQLKAKGSVCFKGDATSVDIIEANENYLQGFRGNKVAMIFQDPMSSLNPTVRVGNQILEAYQLHHKVSTKEGREKVLEMMRKVTLPNPERLYKSYPFQLSGGQRQRVMIAMALINDPQLLIADEATTALDVTVQHEIIQLIKRLQKELEITVLFITHDLSILNNFADYLIVMRDGEIVEQGKYDEVAENPQNPYTKALNTCRPSKESRAYKMPEIEQVMDADEVKLEERKWWIVDKKDILNINHLDVTYNSGTKKAFNALKDISVSIRKGETLGIVGESGCGKTTLSKSILQLLPFMGDVLLDGKPIVIKDRKGEKRFRKRVQFVFQDPYASLNPNMKIGEAIIEVLKIHAVCKGKKQCGEKVSSLLDQVGLQQEHAGRYPHELSGGQRQRVAIARALATEPEILILDEAVAALDVSVQAKVLNLLNDLKLKLGLTYIFISHDLEVVHYMSDRIIVMKDGVIEERGEAEELFNHPLTEYTKKLLNASPGK